MNARSRKGMTVGNITRLETKITKLEEKKKMLPEKERQSEVGAFKRGVQDLPLPHPGSD